MVIQSSLSFEEQPEMPIVASPAKEPVVIKNQNKQIQETTVDKFKAKKYIMLNDIYDQIDAVLYHLQQEGSITSLEGFTEWGITRMSAIIYKLRHIHHIDIESEKMVIKNRFSHETTYSKYKLKNRILDSK